MKGKAAEALSIAARCRNILSANWQAHLNTVKADAKGSKGDIHTSKVLYTFKKGKPYLWVHEGDAHNTNTIIDERGSLTVINAVPGPLVGLLRSIKKEMLEPMRRNPLERKVKEVDELLKILEDQNQENLMTTSIYCKGCRW